MDDISIFQNKETQPTEQDLVESLAATYHLWVHIQDFVMIQYPAGVAAWNFPGKKYGWSFRIKDKKRAIIYFLPREKYFKVAFVFGQKAFDKIMASTISTEIKTELAEAKKYAEGRGIRISVKNKSQLADIKKLIEIKLAT